MLVEVKWGLFANPMHKQCYGNLLTQNGGLGSPGYDTGAFRRRNTLSFPVNSFMFTLVTIVALVFGLGALVIPLNNATMTINGVSQPMPPGLILPLRIIVFAICLIPLFQKLRARSIERQIESSNPSAP